jgi:hypothetical protein
MRTQKRKQEEKGQNAKEQKTLHGTQTYTETSQAQRKENNKKRTRCKGAEKAALTPKRTRKPATARALTKSTGRCNEKEAHV